MSEREPHMETICNIMRKFKYMPITKDFDVLWKQVTTILREIVSVVNDYNNLHRTNMEET